MSKRMTDITSTDLLQAIANRLESIDSTLKEMATDLRATTNQVGSVSEKLTSLEIKVDTRFDQIGQSFEDLKEVTRNQASHIDRLISLSETILQQRAT